MYSILCMNGISNSKLHLKIGWHLAVLIKPVISVFNACRLNKRAEREKTVNKKVVKELLFLNFLSCAVFWYESDFER